MTPGRHSQCSPGSRAKNETRQFLDYALEGRAVLAISGSSSTGLVEISQVRRCLILLCGHQEAIRARKIVLRADEDLGIILGTTDFGPVRPWIGVASIFLIG